MGPGAEYSGSGTDFGFGGFSEVFENIFDDFFGGATTRNTQSEERGSDLRYDLQISFMDAAHGVEKTIEIPRLEICSNCQGSGSKHGTDTKSCRNVLVGGK